MLRPLMGHLFTLFLGGFSGGLVCLLMPRLRQWTPFVALTSILAALLSILPKLGSCIGM